MRALRGKGWFNVWGRKLTKVKRAERGDGAKPC